MNPENKNKLLQTEPEKKEDGADLSAHLPDDIAEAAHAAMFSRDTTEHTHQESLDAEFERVFDVVHEPIALTFNELRNEHDDFEDTLFFCEVYASVYSALKVTHELHTGNEEYDQWKDALQELSDNFNRGNGEWGLKRKKINIRSEVPKEVLSEKDYETGKETYEREIKPRRIAWAVAERALQDAYWSIGHAEIAANVFTPEGHIDLQKDGLLERFHEVKDRATNRKKSVNMAHVVGIPYSEAEFSRVLDELTFEDLTLAT